MLCEQDWTDHLARLTQWWCTAGCLTCAAVACTREPLTTDVPLTVAWALDSLVRKLLSCLALSESLTELCSVHKDMFFLDVELDLVVRTTTTALVARQQ